MNRQPLSNTSKAQGRHTTGQAQPKQVVLMMHRLKESILWLWQGQEQPSTQHHREHGYRIAPAPVPGCEPARWTTPLHLIRCPPTPAVVSRYGQIQVLLQYGSAPVAPICTDATNHPHQGNRSTPRRHVPAQDFWAPQASFGRMPPVRWKRNSEATKTWIISHQIVQKLRARIRGPVDHQQTLPMAIGLLLEGFNQARQPVRCIAIRRDHCDQWNGFNHRSSSAAAKTPDPGFRAHQPGLQTNQGTQQPLQHLRQAIDAASMGVLNMFDQ